jgi:hypothetical protein
MMKKLLISALLVGGAVSTTAAQPHSFLLGTRDAAGPAARELDVSGEVASSFDSLSIEATQGVPIVDKVIIDFSDNERQVVPLEQRKIDRSNPRLIVPFKYPGKGVRDIIVVFGTNSYGDVAVSAF